MVGALLLSGIAAGLYTFDGKQASLTQPLDGPNVWSLNAAASPGCNIKRNISIRGERIYHVPGQAYYAATHINLSKGERWFCSEWRA